MHVSIIFFWETKSDSDLEGLDPRSSSGDLRILLVDFKACRLGHPSFELKCINLFASNVIRTAFIVRNVFDYYIYIYCLVAYLVKVCMLTYSLIYPR